MIAAVLARIQTGLTDLNPVTGPERLPPAETVSALRWFIPALVIALGVIAYLWHRRRARASCDDDTDSGKELNQLLDGPFDSRQFAGQLSQALRRHLHCRHGWEAETMTTSELVGRLPRPWIALFERCDQARYAHEPMTREESAQAVRTAQTLLAEDLPVTGTLPPKKFGDFRQFTSSRPDSEADGMSAAHGAPAAGNSTR